MLVAPNLKNPLIDLANIGLELLPEKISRGKYFRVIVNPMDTVVAKGLWTEVEARTKAEQLNRI